MNIKIKYFDELNTTELYEILKLRQAVFVVEQNCPYHDIDEYDPVSVHLMMIEGDELIGYARITETVSYTHLTLPTKPMMCRSRWSPYH